MNYLPWISALFISLAVSGCQTTGNTLEDKPASLASKAAEINMELGLNYLQRGEYKIALAKLKKSLRQNPKLSSAHNTIAVLYQQLGEDDKAEKHFKEALLLTPNYSEAHNNYGVFLCQHGNYNEAEEHFLFATKNPLYEGIAGAFENAGLCANRIPDVERAQNFLRQALMINPNLTKSLFEMAKISYANHEYDLVNQYLVRYKNINRWDPKSLMLAIKAANKQNDNNAVSSYILLLKAQFPDSNEALQVDKGQY